MLPISVSQNRSTSVNCVYERVYQSSLHPFDYPQLLRITLNISTVHKRLFPPGVWSALLQTFRKITSLLIYSTWLGDLTCLHRSLTMNFVHVFSEPVKREKAKKFYVTKAFRPEVLPYKRRNLPHLHLSSAKCKFVILQSRNVVGASVLQTGFASKSGTTRIKHRQRCYDMTCKCRILRAKNSIETTLSAGFEFMV